jgi:hypothetical protein
VRGWGKEKRNGLTNFGLRPSQRGLDDACNKSKLLARFKEKSDKCDTFIGSKSTRTVWQDCPGVIFPRLFCPRPNAVGLALSSVPRAGPKSSAMPIACPSVSSSSSSSLRRRRRRRRRCCHRPPRLSSSSSRCCCTRPTSS